MRRKTAIGGKPTKVKNNHVKQFKEKNYEEVFSYTYGLQRAANYVLCLEECCTE
jgi:hypothetical protein